MSYCPICNISIGEQEKTEEHQGQKAHIGCLRKLEIRFPAVIAQNHSEKKPPIFRKVQPLKVRGNPFPAPMKTLDVEK